MGSRALWTPRAQDFEGKHPAAVAFEKGGPAALGFGFSAGGLLFSYYIGCRYPSFLVDEANGCSFGHGAANWPGSETSHHVCCRVVYGLHDLGVINSASRFATASATVQLRNSAFVLHMLGATPRLPHSSGFDKVFAAGDTKLAGASAGSLIAACYHSGLPEDVVIKSCFTLAKGTPLCSHSTPGGTQIHLQAGRQRRREASPWRHAIQEPPAAGGVACAGSNLLPRGAKC